MSMSPEARQKISERMKARHAAKRMQESPDTPPIPDTTVQIMEENYLKLQRHIEELEAQLKRIADSPVVPLQTSQTTEQAPQFGRRGNLVGTFERYVVDPAYYPDPRQRLSQESRLQRLAFPLNYELDWKVSTTSYENIDGVRMKEPKFELDLIGIIMDEETGEPTNGRYIVRRSIFHEDPDAAIVMAREKGLEVDESNQRQFLDEMRYLRMRDWLFDIFWPPKPTGQKKNKKDMVIGGKMVEYYEVSSENPETIPFGDLKTKVKG